MLVIVPQEKNYSPMSEQCQLCSSNKLFSHILAIKFLQNVTDIEIIL
jgi:hypothetical protein